MTIEYKIKPVVRYFITRHETYAPESGTKNTMAGSTQNVGSEYFNGETAFEVAYALANAEARRLNLPIGSDEVIFPQTPIEYELRESPVYGVDEIVFHGRPPNRHGDSPVYGPQK